MKPEVEGTNFWAYDLTVGLVTQKIFAAIRDDAGNTTYVTNTVRLTVVTNGTYQYSAAGCLTNIAYKGKDYSQTIGLSWNGQYQLTAVATNGGTAESYGYDALGRRMWTASGGATNWHIYDGPHVIADFNSTGGILRTYTWEPGIDNLLALTVYGSTTSTLYAIKDHLNSVLALVDTTGTIVEQYRYDVWGRTTGFDGTGTPLAESSVGNRYLWQGREYSWKTGLYYFRARYYDSVTGRWLTSDPLGIAGGLNQYVFCANNPVSRRDPLGLQDWGSAFGIYNPGVFVSQAMGDMCGAQTIGEIQGQMFGDTLMHGWILEGELGVAIPLGLSGIGEGIGLLNGATTLGQRWLGIALTFGGGYTLAESGLALTGHEIPGSVSIPANGFITGMDLMRRDFGGILTDIEGWIHRLINKSASKE